MCHQEGLLGNELFAIDGCKMSSNAAKEWSGTFKELDEKRKKLRKQIRYCMKEHKRLDKQDPSGEARQQREKQKIETLTSAFDKIDQFLKAHSPRMGQGKRPKEVKSNITDSESAKMSTSKGTIQGYNGLATVDKKHQIVIDAQAFGHGQEHHTLKPVLKSVKERYARLKIRKNILTKQTIVTADTGFANEANNQYLYENKINAYIPDNQFRRRDPKFSDQKDKYGKRHQKPISGRAPGIIPATEFIFDPIKMTCLCPAGQRISSRGTREDDRGNLYAHFEGRLMQCRNCDIKDRCMRNPDAANHRHGAGRQVSFLMGRSDKAPNYTDWMKQRVDSDEGKQAYSHRMSVVEPVFADIGTNKRLHRFGLRGKDKVQGQWQLYCMVHNIEKIMRYGKSAVNMAA